MQILVTRENFNSSKVQGSGLYKTFAGCKCKQRAPLCFLVRNLIEFQNMLLLLLLGNAKDLTSSAETAELIYEINTRYDKMTIVQVKPQQRT